MYKYISPHDTCQPAKEHTEILEIKRETERAAFAPPMTREPSRDLHETAGILSKREPYSLFFFFKSKSTRVCKTDRSSVSGVFDSSYPFVIIAMIYIAHDFALACM